MRIIMDYEISLDFYFNLISFYGLPEEPIVKDMMSEQTDYVIGQSTSAQYTNGDWVGSLSEFDISSGYWLRMSGESMLSGIGHPYNVKRTYNLNEGFISWVYHLEYAFATHQKP